MTRKATLLTIGTFVIVAIGVHFLFTNQQTARNQNLEKNVTEEREIDLSVVINGVHTDPDSINEIETDDLKPNFQILENTPIEIREIKINGLVLDSAVYKDSDGINRKEFELPFLLRPALNEFEVMLLSGDEEKTFKSKFLLRLKEDFSKSIDESSFLVIPDSTKKIYGKIWYVENGKLKIAKTDGVSHASLAFLYPFADVSVEFNFTPKGGVLNLAFYFLDSGKTIVIGNGNSRRISLLRSGEDSIDGEDFLLKEGAEYRAKISRSNGSYTLLLAEISGDFKQVLNYTDEADSSSFDSVGFSVWSGSDGVVMDDLVISSK